MTLAIITSINFKVGFKPSLRLFLAFPEADRVVYRAIPSIDPTTTTERQITRMKVIFPTIKRSSGSNAE